MFLLYIILVALLPSLSIYVVVKYGFNRIKILLATSSVAHYFGDLLYEIGVALITGVIIGYYFVPFDKVSFDTIIKMAVYGFLAFSAGWALKK